MASLTESEFVIENYPLNTDTTIDNNNIENTNNNNTDINNSIMSDFTIISTGYLKTNNYGNTTNTNNPNNILDSEISIDTIKETYNNHNKGFIHNIKAEITDIKDKIKFNIINTYKEFNIEDYSDVQFFSNKFNIDKDIEVYYSFVNRLIWFSYRRNFNTIVYSKNTYSSDAGWGCMIRAGQMMLANGLVNMTTSNNGCISNICSNIDSLNSNSNNSKYSQFQSYSRFASKSDVKYDLKTNDLMGILLLFYDNSVKLNKTIEYKKAFMYFFSKNGNGINNNNEIKINNYKIKNNIDIVKTNSSNIKKVKDINFEDNNISNTNISTNTTTNNNNNTNTNIYQTTFYPPLNSNNNNPKNNSSNTNINKLNPLQSFEFIDSYMGVRNTFNLTLDNKSKCNPFNINEVKYSKENEEKEKTKEILDQNCTNNPNINLKKTITPPFSIQNICGLGIKFKKGAGNWFSNYNISNILCDLYLKYTPFNYSMLEFDTVIDITSLLDGKYHKNNKENNKDNNIFTKVTCTCSKSLYENINNFEIEQDEENDYEIININPNYEYNTKNCICFENTYKHKPNLLNPRKPNKHNIPDTYYKLNNKFICMVNTRIGLESIDEDYFNAIYSLYNIPNNIGIIGGKGTRALYFIGHAEKKKLVFMDPHFVQDTLGFINSSETYKCKKLYISDVGNISASFTYGFVVNNVEEFSILVDELVVQSKMKYNAVQVK